MKHASYVRSRIEGQQKSLLGAISPASVPAVSDDVPDKEAEFKLRIAQSEASESWHKAQLRYSSDHPSLEVDHSPAEWEPAHLRSRLSNEEIIARSSAAQVERDGQRSAAREGKKPNLGRSNRKRKPERIIQATRPSLVDATSELAKLEELLPFGPLVT